MHQLFVSTAPPPTGVEGIVTFHFSEPWYKPRPVNGKSWEPNEIGFSQGFSQKV